MPKTPKRHLGRLREVRVDMGVLPWYVWVVVGPREDLLRRYVPYARPKGASEPSPGCGACCYEPWENKGPIIWMPALNLGYLAHEAVHAVHMITRELKITLNDDTQELFAYGVSHIMQTVKEGLK